MALVSDKHKDVGTPKLNKAQLPKYSLTLDRSTFFFFVLIYRLKNKILVEFENFTYCSTIATP